MYTYCITSVINVKFANRTISFLETIFTLIPSPPLSFSLSSPDSNSRLIHARLRRHREFVPITRLHFELFESSRVEKIENSRGKAASLPSSLYPPTRAPIVRGRYKQSQRSERGGKEGCRRGEGGGGEISANLSLYIYIHTLFLYSSFFPRCSPLSSFSSGGG